jgi:PAS domain S-box-containing protein
MCLRARIWRPEWSCSTNETGRAGYELMFSLRFERAECEFLSGNFEEAEQLIVDLLQRAASKVDQAATYRLKILLHTLKSENAEAVDSGLSCLRLFDIEIPAHPTQAQVQAEYETVWQILDGRPIESLIDLPMMTDPEMLAATQVYLENSLSSHVFTPNRIAVLEILLSQAAILLENTRLYSDLKEREAKIRRLVDANIMGIYIWNFEGVVLEANEAFLQLVGCRREDLGFGRVRWTDLTPPEWRDRDEQALDALKTTGTVQPYEKEFFEKDGTRVAVLVGAAIFDGSRDQGVAFVVDLSDRKRAEDAERRYHEVHMELAHANRVATLGQLSASIAHEINQPLAGIIANASAGLRLLAADPPNIEDARATAQRTIRDGNRASEIIKRLRALFTKKDLTIESVDLNEATREVIALSSSEIRRNGVIWQAELAEDLPLVRSDRVQLQQVILNLLRNALDSMSAVDDRLKQLIIRTAISDPDHVTLAVQDSGPGVDPANLERIFNAFYTTKPGGLGMGLSVCRAIVEAHGGKLWATAGAPHGATFQLRLPVSADD